MSEKLIRKMIFAGPYDLKAIEEYLEEMAAKGFWFVKQKGLFYYFRKDVPRKVHFAVDVFDKASMFDSRPEAKTEEYIDYCEECGWKFLYSNGKIQFFYTEETNPVPIQTDQRLKLKYINKHVWQSKGPIWFVMFYFLILNLVTGFEHLSAHGLKSENNLVEQYIVGINGSISLLILYALIFYVAVDFFRYLRFYLHNKKRMKAGLSVEYYTSEQTRKFVRNYMILNLVFLLFLMLNAMAIHLWFGIGLLLVLLVLFAISFGMESYRQGNVKLKRIDNIMLTLLVCFVTMFISMISFTGMLFVTLFKGSHSNTEQVKYYNEELRDEDTLIIFHDEIPLTLEDLGIDSHVAEYSQTTKDVYSSAFGEYKTYSHLVFDAGISEEGTEESYPDLSYEILECKWDKIRHSYIEDYLDEGNMVSQKITNQEKDIWKAEEVYSLSENGKECGRIVVYENRVIHIYCPWIDYTQEQINMMESKLCN